MENNRVVVDVAGQTISLRGKEDEAYIKSVASYVDEKVNAMQDKHPALSTSNCVVLCAINLADELFKLRQQYAELDKRIEDLRRITSEQNMPARRIARGPMKRPFEEEAPVTIQP